MRLKEFRKRFQELIRMYNKKTKSRNSESIQKQQKLKTYEERLNQYKINRMFVQNQKGLYQQMDDIRNINNEKPSAEEIKQFWSNI